MKKRPLNVFIDPPRTREPSVADSGLIGRLARSDVEVDTILFGYREDALAQDAVSLTMPVRVDQYDAMAGLLPIFEMNLPEGALRERLRMQFAKTIPEFDDLDLLGIIGSSQIGRLRYGYDARLDARVPTQDLEEVLTYKGSADLFAHLIERFAQFSGVSGMQPKVLIREVGLPAKFTHQGATHIVKAFDSREFPELAANEYLCTLGARVAGIKTAQVRLSANRRLLVVDRFDLTPEGYLGTEDFCVLDGRRAHGRYDGSYEGIAGRIRNFLSPDALAEGLDQFVRQVVYACMIGNGDAHLKNFSVLYRHTLDRVVLAPAYDMVSTKLYIPRDSLALTLGGSKRFPDRARITQFIRAVTSVTEAAALQLLQQVANGAREILKLAAEYGRRHPDASAFTDRLCKVVSEAVKDYA